MADCQTKGCMNRQAFSPVQLTAFEATERSMGTDVFEYSHTQF